MTSEAKPSIHHTGMQECQLTSLDRRQQSALGVTVSRQTTSNEDGHGQFARLLAKQFYNAQHQKLF